MSRQREAEILIEMNFWQRVNGPNSLNVLHTIFFVRKKEEHRNFQRHKPWLVGRGKKRLAYGNDTLSLISDLRALRLLLYISKQRTWIPWHMGFSKAFLNGTPDMVIYVEQWSHSYDKQERQTKVSDSNSHYVAMGNLQWLGSML